MTGSQNTRNVLAVSFNPRRVLMLTAMLFGSMVTMLLRPAHGQECDPSWYNPWAAPTTAVAQSAQPQAAAHKRQTRLKAVSSSQRAGKVRVKAAAAQTRPS